MLLEDNFSYVAENAAASRMTDIQKVFIVCSVLTGDIETSHKKRHHLTVSLAFCFSEMSDKTAA
jgi:hypothetical protein